jgi:hypothetical protein
MVELRSGVLGWHAGLNEQTPFSCEFVVIQFGSAAREGSFSSFPEIMACIR